MTNQHSTTGEREEIARLLCRQHYEDQGLSSSKVDKLVEDEWVKWRHMADEVIVILSRPSRMAAASEGEALATKWEAECDRTPYEPGKECTGRRVALTQCARELRAMLGARRDTGSASITLADELEGVISDLESSGWARAGQCINTLKSVARSIAATPPVAVPVLGEMVERALKASVPGGSEVWCWLPQKDAWTPHETARDVMRCALTAALAVPDKGVQGDQGSSGGLGQPGSGSQPGAGVGATAALAKVIIALDVMSDAAFDLQECAERFSVSGVYFNEPIFTENVEALKKLDAAEQLRAAVLGDLHREGMYPIQGAGSGWPEDGSCRECSAVPRSPSTGLCATCEDEVADALSSASTVREE